MQGIAEWTNVDRDTFDKEIAAQGRPAVLRGLVRHWPAVQAALGSVEEAGDYLKAFDRGQVLPVLVGPHSIHGRLFYQDDMSRLNFERQPLTLSAALTRILDQRAEERPATVYLQSAPATQAAPGFERANTLDLIDAAIEPRIWIGTPVSVAAHFDLSQNIACVVAGRRRVTLFPPDQLANLYLGPVDFSPAGTPISMVSVEEPDFQRYPRFREALASAQQAELGPGDAVYIPYFWWHAIRSIEPFNVLVNYWWNATLPWASPYDSLLHAVLALRDLPEEQRDAWRVMFDYFVFKTSGEPMAHLAPEHRGALGPLTPGRVQQLRMVLARALSM